MAQFGSAVNSAHIINGDRSVIGVIGTLGTADISGTSLTLPIGVDPATGAQYVYNLGPAGSVTLGNTPGGTINLIGSISTIGTLPSISTTVNPNLPVIAGTPADPGTPLTVRLTDGTSYYNASGGGGTNVNIITGTLQSSGTITGVGTITNVGSLTNAGTIKEITNIAGGTVTIGTVVGLGTITNIGSISNIGTMPAISLALNTGTITTIVAGTQNTLGTVGVLNAGTLGLVTRIGNIGTIESGTVTTTLALNTGTLTTIAAGTQNTLGTVGVVNTGTLAQVALVSALTSGSVTMQVGTLTTGTLQNLVTGTINSVGTVPGIGTLTNLGSVTNVGALGLGTVYKGVPAPAAGSFTAAGTINITGSQLDAAYFDIGGTYVGTGFFEGQVGTSAFFALNAITPLGVIGSQTTGNGDYLISMAGLDAARFRLTYSSGTLTYNTRSSNFFAPFMSVVGGSVGTIGGLGALTTVSNITNGSINILTGTLQSAGTTTGVGVVTTVTTVSNITNGSVTMQVGTLTTGTLQNLVTGTINALAAGTITGGTLTNLVSGTINALAAGTITAGTLTNLVSGTINALAAGTITAGTLTNLNYGTIQVDPKPIINGTYGVTVGTTGAAVWGTLIASVGNGNKIYLQGIDIVVVSGTVEVAIANNIAGSTGTGVFTRGNFVPGGGISKHYDPVLFTGTGGTLAYWLGGAGTVDMSYQYWVAA